MWEESVQLCMLGFGLEKIMVFLYYELKILIKRGKWRAQWSTL
jgi:hypothetical protein